MAWVQSQPRGIIVNHRSADATRQIVRVQKFVIPEAGMINVNKVGKSVYCSRNILPHLICAEHRAGKQSGSDVQRSALCWFVILLPGSGYYSLI